MFYTYKNLKIYYEIMGKGKPIIFLHGWGSSSDVFKFISLSLCKKYCVYLIDFPGFGKSIEPDYLIDVAELTNIVRSFIDCLSITNPIIIGHSYGGRVGIEYASKYKNIDKLILIDSAGIKRFNFVKFIKIKIYKFKKWFYKFTKQVMKYNELLISSGSSDYINSSLIKKKMLVAAVNYDQKKVMRKISCETLIIWGEYDDVTLLKDGKLMNKLIKSSELVVIPNARHFPFIENYSYFKKVMESYLEV